MPIDLRNSRVLVTNDDGYGAPGLEILIEIAHSLASEVWVVAPAEESSGTGHSITVRRPLTVKQKNAKTYTVDGTPTDCIILAVNEIMKDNLPNLVLSGVNSGVNIAEDVSYSGTIGAAMEATIAGVPAIALSQEMSGSELSWNVAKKNAAEIITKLSSLEWISDTLINVNFPFSEKEQGKYQITRQGRQKRGDQVSLIEQRDSINKYQIGQVKLNGITQSCTDAESLKNGAISITPLSISFTEEAFFRSLRRNM
ncbi:MAG: 5'/3'-nucleotidase SurE [Rhodospirillaceae bacterium]|nr:5'/3'-nucleotidase SurE [Rhodospirillaceae bacterium]|tara:strand:- start:1539 stop:2303 length:765 start_codon:yes stop_codon:yes gene_type:complete